MTDADEPADEPLYERIGDGRINDAELDAAESRLSPRAADAGRIGLEALATALHTVRSARFWWTSAALLAACWGVGVLLVIALVTGGDLPPESHIWVYILTAAMLVLASCVLAVRWADGRSGTARAPVGGDVEGPLPDWARSSAKGVIFACLSGAFLLLLAFWSGTSPAIAVVAFVLMLIEGFVFSGIGAGASQWFEGGRGMILAWSVTALFLVGNVVALVALLPSVRAYEPVLVAINIERDDLGRVTSYQCSPEFRGIAEVYHTERIFWLITSNPLVLLALIAGEAEPKDNSLAWLPGELQNAAEGTQVPCVEGQELEKTGAEMPLALAGIATQAAVAGALLAAGHRAALRRLRPAA